MSQKQEYRCQWPVASGYKILFLLLLITVHFSLVTVFAGCGGHRIIVTKDPLKAEEHIRLAQIYETKGETGLAIQEYKKAVAQDSVNPAAYFGLGNVSYKNGEYKDAEDYYKKAIENSPADDPKIAIFYNNLSWVYIDANRDLRDAEKLVQKALLLDKERDYIYLDTLGVIYTRLNEYKNAEDAFFSALKNAPDDKTTLRHIYTHLIELYRAEGDGDKIKEWTQRLEGLDK